MIATAQRPDEPATEQVRQKAVEWLVRAADMAAAAAATWHFLPPTKHSARTLLRVPPERRFLLNTAEPVTDLAGHQKNQIALVKSRLVLNAALKLPKVAQLDTIRREITLRSYSIPRSPRTLARVTFPNTCAAGQPLV